MVLYWAATASYARLFIYDVLVHKSPQEDAARLFSPLLLAFPAPELSRMGRELKKIHPVHAPGEDSSSQAATPCPEHQSHLQRVIFDTANISAHILSCAPTCGGLGVQGKRHHTQRPVFRCSCLDHFLVALAQEEPFWCDCWSTHTEKTPGFLKAMLCKLGVRCMGLLRTTHQGISTRVASTCALLAH